MGVVYKARDLKLDRVVALKFLPTDLTRDEEAKNRFIHEAKAVSSLDHQNICNIHEINETEDGQIFIVMACYEGESLKEIIDRGPLPVDKALDITINIARGLEKAHSKNIVHRDIKPANILLTDDGVVKIVDFGLAKLAGQTKLTRIGTTLGTAAYMSPEQARGETVDYRSDIFSLGVVLYEMISGTPPFKGEYESAVLYSVLNSDPSPLTALRTGVPIQLDFIISKLLSKDPENRYQNLGELTVDLKNINTASSAGSSASINSPAAGITKKSGSHFKIINWKLDVPLLVILVILLYTVFRLFFNSQEAEFKQVIRYSILPLPGQDLGAPSSVILSPDGTRMIYSATDSEGNFLFLHRMDQLESEQLPGTKDASFPFFSPDGRWIGFEAGGDLKKLFLDGGQPITLCKTGSGFAGGCWSREKIIIFGFRRSGLLRISVNGGVPDTLTFPESNTSHRWPEILPGGKTVLFTVWPSQHEEPVLVNSARIASLSLITGKWEELFSGGCFPKYIVSPDEEESYILFARLSGIMATPFNENKQKISNLSLPVLTDVNVRNDGYGCFAVSDQGTLVYKPNSKDITERHLVWMDRKGRMTKIARVPNWTATCELSPDNKQVVLQMADEESKTYIYVYDMEKSNFRQLTFTGSEVSPVYDPEGGRVVYGTNSGPYKGTKQIFQLSVNSDKKAVPFLEDEYSIIPVSWNRVLNYLAFYRVHPATSRDIWIFDMKDSTAHPLIATEANEIWPVFSPSGKFLAYVSNETGKNELYVQPYPLNGEKYLISPGTGSAQEPVWSHDGSVLYYRSQDNLYAVDIEETPHFKAGIPRLLFSGKFYSGWTSPGFDMDKEGNRFLMVTWERQEVDRGRIHIVVNWTEELKQRMRRN